MKSLFSSLLGPHDVLQDGTKISTGNQFGTVVHHELVDAIPAGKIIVHTVTMTHKSVPDWGNKTKLVALPKPITKKVNYTAIRVIDW